MSDSSPVDPSLPAPTPSPTERLEGIKADILAGLSIPEIKSKWHCSQQKIGAIKKGLAGNLQTYGVRKKEMPAKLYQIADLAIRAITPTKLAAASAPQLITTAAIAIDKARLMEGLSTDNMDIRTVIPRIEEQLKATADAQADVIEMIRKRGGSYEPKESAA